MKLLKKLLFLGLIAGAIGMVAKKLSAGHEEDEWGHQHGHYGHEHGEEQPAPQPGVDDTTS